VNPSDGPGGAAPHVVDLGGNLDPESRDGVIRRCEEALSHPLVRDLVVDLAAVDFVDSSGLSALITVARLAQDHGVSLRLRAVPPRVRSLIDRTGLQEVLPSEDGVPPSAD
jgi:anti-anti-sigma factor